MLMPSVQQPGLVNTNKTQVAAAAGFTHPLLTSSAPKQKIIHYKKAPHFFSMGSYVTSVPVANWTSLRSKLVSQCGSCVIKPDFGTSLWCSSLCSKTVCANWSSSVLRHMNHTFPRRPIFTAAAHLDLLKHLKKGEKRKENSESLRVGFSHALRSAAVSG